MTPRDHSPPRLLITAGPTLEPIDAVRYLANRSSGRMGLALAAAAAERGHRTTLLLGPTPLQPTDHTLLRVVRFESMDDLEAALHQQWPDHDVLLMAAAVADFRPARVRATKVRRGDGPFVLELATTPDLLSQLAPLSRPGQIRIGFALEEPGLLADAARRKLREKSAHAIVANPLATMGSDRVTATVFLPDGTTLAPAPALTKDEFARWLIDRLGDIENHSH